MKHTSRLTGRRPSASLVISSLALFVSLGGVGYAATGGSLILGSANSANATTSLSSNAAPALKLTNTNSGAAATPLNLTITGTKAPPFTTNSKVKVANLNADLLDGLDSSNFLLSGQPFSLSVNTTGNGIESDNSGGGNGIQGVSNGAGSSGVYGENDSTGYGVAGRSTNPNGTGLYGQANGSGSGHAIVGLAASTAGAADITNQGTGPALALHSSGAPMSVDSSVKVTNLNADKVDGASIVSNRIISTTPGDHVLDVPGFGHFGVDGCDHTNARVNWNSDGTGNAYFTEYDVANPGDAVLGAIWGNFVSGTHPHLYEIIQLARNTGSGTSVAQITLTASGPDCVFAAMATVQPS